MTEEEKKLLQDQQGQNTQIPQPAYSSPWQSELEDTWKQIQNSPAFKYDVNADALWNQYKDQYIRQGQMAMEDTMGKAQTMTGGYGNSYAQSVGQQTYQDYLQGMTDKLPQFYQMAQDQYKAQNDDLLNRYGILSDLESKDYTRWMDTQAQRNWQTEWDEYIRRYNYEHGLGEFASTGGGGGGSSSSGGSSNSGGGAGGGKQTNAEVDMDSVIHLGYGPISGDELSDLVASGAVNATTQGNKIIVSNNEVKKPDKFGTLFNSLNRLY